MTPHCKIRHSRTIQSLHRSFSLLHHACSKPELVTHLTAEHFLLAFRWYCTGKSVPTTVVSDNATYFIARESAILSILEDDAIQQQTSSCKKSSGYTFPEDHQREEDCTKKLSVLSKT